MFVASTCFLCLFVFSAAAPAEIYTLSLHDALPISMRAALAGPLPDQGEPAARVVEALADRKSTRLNSSHTVTSYAVFCLKKTKPGSHPQGVVPAHHAQPRGGARARHVDGDAPGRRI